jgi:response regulator RpfG family c-di-GMP phosphodiesterase
MRDLKVNFKQVFWISPDQFVLKMVEKLFKGHGDAIYTSPEYLGIDYLLQDIKPDLLIFDLDAVNQDYQAFSQQLTEHKQQLFKVAYANKQTWEQFADKQQINAFISKPLEVNSLYQQLKKLGQSH